MCLPLGHASLGFNRLHSPNGSFSAAGLPAFPQARDLPFVVVRGRARGGFMRKDDGLSLAGQDPTGGECRIFQVCPFPPPAIFILFFSGGGGNLSSRRRSPPFKPLVPTRLHLKVHGSARTLRVVEQPLATVAATGLSKRDCYIILRKQVRQGAALILCVPPTHP